MGALSLPRNGPSNFWTIELNYYRQLDDGRERGENVDVYIYT